MWIRVASMCVITVTFALVMCQSAFGQNQVPDFGRRDSAAWRPSFNPVNPDGFDRQQQFSQGAQNPGNNWNSTPQQNDQENRYASRPFSATEGQRPGVTKVTRSSFEKLPSAAGQVWREYDITPYTTELERIQNPENAVRDWIIKETGTQTWFAGQMSILSVAENRVIVYHTPEIQRVVKAIIDRFNRTRAQTQVFDVNLVTIDNPNWRATAYPVLQPIEVRSPGIEAWLVSKENAALLQNQLARRADFKRHSGGRVAAPDGQTFVLEKSEPVSFIQSLQWVPDQIPNYQPKNETINEGYRLALSCLTSLDNRTIEAIIDCDVDQVEKLTPVKVDLPAPGGILTQLDLNVPQLVSWRLNERVRWPADQVLLLSCGIVASPESKQNLPRGAFNMLSRFQTSKRTNALLFIEFRGPQSGSTVSRAAESGSGLVPVNRR